jgi:hypothetical protein
VVHLLHSPDQQHCLRCREVLSYLFAVRVPQLWSPLRGCGWCWCLSNILAAASAGH